jgi:hypothetical protein
MDLGGCWAPPERSGRKPDDHPLRRLEPAGMVKGTFEMRVPRDAGGADNRARVIHTHRECPLEEAG